ncbi:MAG: HTH domain-containing protein [Euryarchaeota archaeon]|nr:HTH domain-containing protein [Euryarchaeota archaeon]
MSLSHAEAEPRERILSLLESARGYVSGEEIASRLGISRSAVWKHVRALVEQGAEIRTSRRGYMLLSPPDLILRSRVTERLTLAGCFTCMRSWAQPAMLQSSLPGRALPRARLCVRSSRAPAGAGWAGAGTHRAAGCGSR